VDRWRSQRVMMLATALCLVCNLVCFVFIQGKWSYMVCMILWFIPLFLISVANAVWFPDLLPRACFGQFASAASIVAAGGAMLLGPLCGWVFDQIHVYRYAFLWPVILQALSLAALVPVYRGWKQNGGPDHYQAPLRTP
jgi:nitrate/nitrite transporter NarK